MSFSNQIILNAFSKKKSPAEIFFKYLSYLPLFILFLALSYAVGILYIRYSPPVYKSSAQILVKADNNSGKSGNNDLIDAALFGGKRINIDNEMEQIKSKAALYEAVVNYGFNVLYYNEGNIRRSDIYTNAPFKCEFTAVPDSNQNFIFYLEDVTPKGATFFAGLGNDKKSKGSAFKWGQKLQFSGWSFQLLPRGAMSPEDNNTYVVNWKPVRQVVGEISGGLKVGTLNNRATIITLTLESDNPTRGADILDAVIEEYMKFNVDDKNRVAVNTINFINTRLDLVTKELSGVESNLEDFRTKSQLYDPKSQMEQLVESSSESDKNLLQLNIKARVVADLISEVTNNKEKIVPSNLGIEDPAVIALVAKFNEIRLKIERETPLSAPNSLPLQDMRNQAADLRASLLEALKNFQRQLQAQIGDINQRNNQYKTYLMQIPTKERTMKEISRKQAIQEGLYLYLLQRREETAITTASNIANYQQIDKAVGYGPTSPNTSRIKLYAIIIGLLIPIAIVYVKDQLNDKVTSKNDVTEKTKIPFLGEIGHVDNRKALVVANKSRSILAEQFRIIRNNLQFLMRDNQVLMVTSSISGEGKSFVSLNIAAVFAISGKKVALLEFDLRKPRIVKNIGYEAKPEGISNYLVGTANDLDKLYIELPEYPTLHLYGSGAIPPNPAELMLTDRMAVLFDELKKKYDYVIIDSAPVGLVSDSFNIGEFADSTIYVIRQRYTYKNQVDFINDIYEAKKLKNMGLIINDVKVGGRYGYYGYGYGTGYGYGYGYGYGKGYGEYFDDGKGGIFKGPARFMKKIFKGG